MKTFSTPLFVICASIMMLGLNSCDILEQLFVNLKLKETITAQGNGPNISEIIEDCLSNYDAYDDYRDEIMSLKYVSAAYYSEDFTPGLTGTNIIATIYNGCTFAPIFQVFLPTANAADYVDNPFEFELTSEEIAAFNQFLADYNNCDCFFAELLVEQVSANSGPPYFLDGTVEIIIEIEAKVN